jgi:hypothetical protein
MRNLRDHEAAIRLPNSSDLLKHIESCTLWLTIGRDNHIARGSHGLEINVDIACQDETPSILALAPAIVPSVQRVL